MSRLWALVMTGLWLSAAASEAAGPIGDLRVEIQTPVQGQVISTAQTSVEVVALEDIQYHIYVRQKIQRGLDAASEGKVIAQEEVERRLARWLEK